MCTEFTADTAVQNSSTEQIIMLHVSRGNPSITTFYNILLVIKIIIGKPDSPNDRKK